MASGDKQKNPGRYEHIEMLRRGEEYTDTIPDGGNLASMRKAIKHGQTLIFSPVVDYSDVKVGDMAFIDWHSHGGTYIFHIVHEIKGDQFLIANSLGKINGWVHGSAIVGKVTQIIEPEPRPDQPEILRRLDDAYNELAARCNASLEDRDRLKAIVHDLGWYGKRIHPAKHDVLPKLNMWSYMQILWHLMKQAEQAVGAASTNILYQQIDYGKKHVGKVVEIVEVFATSDDEFV
jgi:hypothetical protein